MPPQIGKGLRQEGEVIVRAHEGELWLFDQRGHSELCGEMAEAWGAAGFEPAPAPVRRAARIHDSGWTEWDERPRLDPETGRPHPYSRMPDEDYREIWRRGLRRGWAEGDLPGLLVSLHAMRFFARKQAPEDRALLETERHRQAAALRRLDLPGSGEVLPEPVATWHAWMFFWDGLSLFLCEGWESPWSYRVPGGEAAQELRVTRSGGDGLAGPIAIRPYPFDRPLAISIVARLIQDRGYGSQGELDAAVAAAKPRRVEWTIGDEG